MNSMRSLVRISRYGCLALLLCSTMRMFGAPANSGEIKTDWNNVVADSRTSLSIQVCLEPPLRRDSPIHDELFKSMHDLNVDFPRFQPWRTYPKIVVGELEPPRDGKTSWDFSLLDPILEDFMKAAGGHPVEMDISTDSAMDVQVRQARARSPRTPTRLPGITNKAPSREIRA